MSKNTLFFLLSISIIIIIGSFYMITKIDPGFKPKPVPVLNTLITPEIKINQEFKLKFTDNSDFTFSNLKGKYTLAYFGFSYCPDICPVTLQKMAKVANLLGQEDLKQTQLIFVSIDPARDNIDTLNKFVLEYSDGKVIGATGEQAEIDKLATSLKAYFVKNDDSTADKHNYYVDHSSYIYLVNPEGELIGQFSAKASAEEISTYLKDKMEISK